MTLVVVNQQFPHFISVESPIKSALFGSLVQPEYSYYTLIIRSVICFFTRYFTSKKSRKKENKLKYKKVKHANDIELGAILKEETVRTANGTLYFLLILLWVTGQFKVPTTDGMATILTLSTRSRALYIYSRLYCIFIYQHKNLRTDLGGVKGLTALYEISFWNCVSYFHLRLNVSNFWDLWVPMMKILHQKFKIFSPITLTPMNRSKSIKWF